MYFIDFFEHLFILLSQHTFLDTISSLIMEKKIEFAEVNFTPKTTTLNIG